MLSQFRSTLSAAVAGPVGHAKVAGRHRHHDRRAPAAHDQPGLARRQAHARRDQAARPPWTPTRRRVRTLLGGTRGTNGFAQAVPQRPDQLPGLGGPDPGPDHLRHLRPLRPRDEADDLRRPHGLQAGAADQKQFTAMETALQPTARRRLEAVELRPARSGPRPQHRRSPAQPVRPPPSEAIHHEPLRQPAGLPRLRGPDRLSRAARRDALRRRRALPAPGRGRHERGRAGCTASRS